MLYIHEYDEPELAAAKPDPIIASAMAEARERDIISFDDTLDHLRRPWWRRVLDKIIHPFRRR